MKIKINIMNTLLVAVYINEYTFETLCIETVFAVATEDCKQWER